MRYDLPQPPAPNSSCNLPILAVRKNDSCKTVNGSETVLSLENKRVSWADVVRGRGEK